MDDWDIRPSATVTPPASAAQPPVIASRITLDAARRGVVLLQVAAAVVLGVGIITQLLLVTDDSDYYGPGQGVDLPLRTLVLQFLQGLEWPLGLAALVLAGSFLLQVQVARAEHELEGPPARVAAKPDASGDLTLKSPVRRPLATRPAGAPAAPATDDSIWRPQDSSAVVAAPGGPLAGANQAPSPQTLLHSLAGPESSPGA